jgi:hypothetical protein
MASHVTFKYDALGDILYVNFVPPYAEQESDMIGDGVVARTNPTTGRVENLELLWFMATLRGGDSIDLPVDPDLTPIWSEIDADSPPAKQNAGRRAVS